MLKLCLTLSVAFVLQGSRACEEQLPIFRKFIPDNWNYGKSFYYQPNLVVPEHAGRYEWQTPLNNHGSPFVNPFLEYYYNGERNRNRFANIYGVNSYEEESLEGRAKKPLSSSINSLQKYFVNKNVVDEEEVNQAESESRFISGNGIFNDQLRPGNKLGFLFNLANRIPFSIIPNSGRPFDACTTQNGDTGICTSGFVCSLFGGRPSGSCFLGNICCVNTVNQCGGTVTLNNTYWQSPTVAIKSPTICALNIKLDTNYVEQLGKPICQIRLDFVSFSIAQPSGGTCTDSFQVGGATTVAPIICGDNSGQHMYLDVPSSDVTSTDVQLMFSFATGTAAPSSRSWNIKIALLPCGADYLAPVDCLQYFTAPTGRVSSFNWRDVPVSAIRQLNNQNYNICFRTELVDRQKATQICLSVCATSNAGAGYSITTNAVNAGNSLLGVGNSANGYCTYDFLAIVGATDLSTGLVGDRFCGEKLSTARAPGVAVNGQLCTKIMPFKLIYGTDGTEAEVGAPALVSTPADTNNVGFCLDYQERAN
ncbi:uncharacterized protein LOC124205840 [Daphnia pulex]|uniref:uncharacterized protein LOC124205840 n=1 Tax=Daphnia pulex TaxID=6669 RepID=UPI001EDFA06E|nr:uncharacterized protein LOC124205840 [Daphnia pulex]